MNCIIIKNFPQSLRTNQLAKIHGSMITTVICTPQPYAKFLTRIFPYHPASIQFFVLLHEGIEPRPCMTQPVKHGFTRSCPDGNPWSRKCRRIFSLRHRLGAIRRHATGRTTWPPARGELPGRIPSAARTDRAPRSCSSR